MYGRILLSVVLGVLMCGYHDVTGSTTDDAFLASCKKYFYRGLPPTGLTSPNYKYICQRYQAAFYYATLYDVAHRIPIYSAYQIEHLACHGSQPARRDKWFIEPELAGRQEQADMDTDKKSDYDWVRPVQAVNLDYIDTDFDRGHLNPNFHHCNESRTATFTLTNSIPQDACFNRIVWYGAESDLVNDLKERCHLSEAKRFIITGAVPSFNDSIPRPDMIIEDHPDRPNNRVNVPSHVWTAACCDSATKYFHGHIGENWAGAKLEHFNTVKEMNERLSTLYGSPVEIFADGCTEPSAPFG